MSAAVIDTNLIFNRAKAIAAMGLVERDYDGFNVRSSGLKKETYRIWRDEENRVRCNCPEFEDMVEREPRFRCEHILAVKFHLNPPDEEQVSEAAFVDEIDEENQEMMAETIVSQAITINSGTMEQSDFAGVLDALSRAVSPDKIKHRIGWRDRSGREREVDYVEWHTVADLLDQICPEWSHQVSNIQQIGDMVAVTASITIQGVTRQGVGTGSAFEEKGIKKAEHDALKRAAVKFGIARDLYRREDEVNNHDSEENGANQKTFPSEPVAKTMADLVTPKQLVAIRAIAHAQRVNAEAECVKLMGCRPEELTRRAASAFIDHLKSIPVEANEIRQVG